MAKRDMFEGVPRDPCEPLKKVEKWDVYAKNKYCPKIKVTNWWYHREGYPKDNDDVVKAAYKRWGTWEEDESHWRTETMEALEDGRGDPELNSLKSQVKPLQMLSFLSYPMTLYGGADEEQKWLKFFPCSTPCPAPQLSATTFPGALSGPAPTPTPHHDFCYSKFIFTRLKKFNFLEFNS